MNVYVASFVNPVLVSVALITIVYVPAGILAAIVIFPSSSTVIYVVLLFDESFSDCFVYLYEPVPFVASVTFAL